MAGSYSHENDGHAWDESHSNGVPTRKVRVSLGERQPNVTLEPAPTRFQPVFGRPPGISNPDCRTSDWNLRDPTFSIACETIEKLLEISNQSKISNFFKFERNSNLVVVRLKYTSFRKYSKSLLVSKKKNLDSRELGENKNIYASFPPTITGRATAVSNRCFVRFLELDIL